MIARLPDPPERIEDLLGWAREFTRSVQATLDVLTTQAGAGYRVSNYTEFRELDAAATSLVEVTDLLCTLVDDLKNGKQGTQLG